MKHTVVQDLLSIGRRNGIDYESTNFVQWKVEKKVLLIGTDANK